MRKLVVFLLCIAILLIACQTVPVTGRRQLGLIPAGTINAMSADNYNDFVAKHKVIKGTAQTHMVQRIGKRIQKGVEHYFAEQNMSERLNGYEWEFNLVEDETVNAWCMPGGKVVVYTGILPVAKNEAGLAVVMGHEIAHAVAGHGNERLSQGLLVQMGGMALSTALAEKPRETQNLFMAAFGLGAQVGILLPYSRLHESEADHLGLIFMAIAGYDPHNGVDFWERMASSKKDAAPPQFLSTHPSDATRINNIKALIPEAMAYYRR